MMREGGRKKVTDTTVVSARERFGGYGSGKRQRTGKVDVREERVNEFVRLFLRFDAEVNEMMEIDDHYETAIDMLSSEEIKKKLGKITAKDVEEFAFILKAFQYVDDFPLKAGLFLNAMINLGEDEDYYIPTKHLDEKLALIGYENGVDEKGKNIIIDGDAGWSIGYYMWEGSITVKGNVGKWVGSNLSRGGTITVEGNAGDEVGANANGGKIIIMGNAGKDIGWDAGDVIEYGWEAEYQGKSFEDIKSLEDIDLDKLDILEVHIEGEYEGLWKHRHGYLTRILLFHKGKLVSASKEDILREILGELRDGNKEE